MTLIYDEWVSVLFLKANKVKTVTVSTLEMLPIFFSHHWTKKFSFFFFVSLVSVYILVLCNMIHCIFFHFPLWESFATSKSKLRNQTKDLHIFQILSPEMKCTREGANLLFKSVFIGKGPYVFKDDSRRMWLTFQVQAE